MKSTADPIYNNETIYTPNGTAIPASKLVSGDFNSSQKNEAKDYWIDYCSNRITYAGEATYADKSSVRVSRSSTPRSCNLYARAHNSYGWGEWQAIGWLYASQSYSLCTN